MMQYRTLGRTGVQVSVLCLGAMNFGSPTGEADAAQILNLALLWVKEQPGVTSPIVGPRTLAHLEDALTVADTSLAEEDRPLFDALVHPGTAVSDFHNTNSWMKARIVEA